MALRDIAKQHINAGSKLREGREKVAIEALVGNPITLTEVDLTHGDDGDYFIINWLEDQKGFTHTPSAITDFLNRMISDPEVGSLTEFNNQLKAEGGLVLTIIKQKSKKGREYFTLAS